MVHVFFKTMYYIYLTLGLIKITFQINLSKLFLRSFLQRLAALVAWRVLNWWQSNWDLKLFFTEDGENQAQEVTNPLLVSFTVECKVGKE
jgi:hypothetical protein